MSSPVPIEPIKDAPRRSVLARFANDRSGATAIEYGLIGGLIALAVTPSIRTAMTQLWNTIMIGVSAQ
ncbi:Flp family type IVb pilin [Methylobacterium sp. C25]|uniref:Flp family type IVb pilin n=1 Tax=Methylobacterium sp. C25 TaxID=2721622 RepID=UPI001F44EBAB|nr:Flp family type IVb pilin [Methylobacterium sp. C25]